MKWKNVCMMGGCTDEYFESLTDQQVKTYMERFAVPEMFLNFGGGLFVLPYL